MDFNEWKNKKWFPYTVATCSAVLLYAVLMNLGGIGKVLGQVFRFFSPVVIGIALAYIVEPLVTYLQNRVFRKVKSKKMNRSLSVILALVIEIFFLVLILSSLIPQLINSLTTFVANYNTYSAQLQAWLENLSDRFLMMHIDLSRTFESNVNLLNQLDSQLPDLLNRIIAASSEVGEHVVNWAIGAILAVYFLFDKERILWGAKALIILISEPVKYKRAFRFLKSCNDIMVKYIIAELVEALVVGCVNLIFMLIMGMPYAVLVSVVVGITNMIPTVGPIFGALAGGLILLLADPWKALWFFIFTAILQFLDGYILKPKMYGETLGVSSVMILISITIGGKMFGMLGILLAIPFAAIISIVYNKFLTILLEKKALKLGIDEDDPGKR